MIVFVLSYLILLIILFWLCAADRSNRNDRIDINVCIVIIIFLFMFVPERVFSLYCSGAHINLWWLYLNFITILMIILLALYIRRSMSGKANVLGFSITNRIAITVLVYLVFLAIPYYANEYKLCMPSGIGDIVELFLKVLKSIIRGLHFAIMAMTTGVLAQKTGLAHNVLKFYYDQGVLFLPFYLLTGFVVTIAPLSTLTVLASILSERARSWFRLLVVAANNKMIFFDASVENLHIAKCIKNVNNSIKFVFCRSGSDELEQIPDRKTVIRDVWGICLPDAETYYRFKGDNIYLLSTDNLRTAYEYVRHLIVISERVGKILVLANDAKDRIEMVKNADPNNLFDGRIYFFSFWETVAGKMYKDMSNSEILFILGDDGLERAFLNRMKKEQKEAGGNAKQLQLVVFSPSEREYRILSLMKEREYKELNLRIIKPVGLQDSVDSKLNDYIENYEPEKERHIILLYEKCETNLNIKRYISRQYDKRVINKNLTIMIYCDDPIIQKEEEKYDELILRADSEDPIDVHNMIRYYGVKEFLINDIMEEKEWKKAVNL